MMKLMLSPRGLMRGNNVVCFFVLVTWAVTAAARNAPIDTQKIGVALLRLCTADVSTQVIIARPGKTSFSLQLLDSKGKPTSKFKIKKSDAEKLIAGMRNAVTQAAPEQADKMANCLNTIIERLDLLALRQPLEKQRPQETLREEQEAPQRAGARGPGSPPPPPPPQVTVSAPPNLPAPVRRISDTLVRLCAEDVGTQAVIPQPGKTSFSLRLLDSKGKPTSKFKIKISDAEKLVAGMRNAATQAVPEQADKMVNCLTPIIEKLDLLASRQPLEEQRPQEALREQQEAPQRAGGQDLGSSPPPPPPQVAVGAPPILPAPFRRISNAIVRLCAADVGTQAVIPRFGKTSFSLQLLGSKGKPTSKFQIKNSAAEKLVAGVTNAVTQAAPEQADKMADCLNSIIERLGVLASRQPLEEQRPQEALREQQEEPKRQEALREQQQELKRQEALREQQQELKRQEALREQQQTQREEFLRAQVPSGPSPPLPPSQVAVSALPVVPTLVPVRSYLRAKDIPPSQIAAYGVVAFRSKPTSANRDRLFNACVAYTAHLPRTETLPSSLPTTDQMLTIWPLEDPSAPAAIADDCQFVVEHYDLYGGVSAIQDAQRHGGELDGRGPFLIGRFPSQGVPDKVVLVVDLSSFENQDSFDNAFLFWQTKIVEDPMLWVSGFSVERLRLAIRDFANHYGQDVMIATKILGIKN